VLDLYPVPHPEVGIERVGGRLLAVSPDDHLHSFVAGDDAPSHTAERIVELSDGQRTVRQIAAALRDEFDEAPPLDAIEADVSAFVETLVARHVLVVHNHPLP
jgi:pyrroloquinoline quinone biosynthesis protein D